MIDILVGLFEDRDVDMGTIVSTKLNVIDLLDPNVVKAIIDQESNAIEFKRNIYDLEIGGVYRHIGIYGFTKNALNKYINLKRSNLELSRNLEQMRALENNMKIDVLYTDSDPLSVDTEADLEEIKNLMEK